MKRRELLHGAGAVGALGLAGCLDAVSGVLGGGPTVADSTLESTGASCANDDTGQADVSFLSGSSTVQVSGTITAPDTCWEAGLGNVALEDGRLDVIVNVHTTGEGGGACFDCDPGVGYTAVIGFEGSLPDRVAVHHDHGQDDLETVANVERE